MRLEIKHFELLEAIYSEGTMTKASEKLFLSQPALSHQLRDLEDRLGVKLFLRAKKKLYLTGAGRKLLESGCEILEKVRDIEYRIQNNNDGVENILRIHITNYSSYFWIPKIIKRMRYLGERLRVLPIINLSESPYNALYHGLIDVVITTNEEDYPEIKKEHLIDDEMIAIVSKDRFNTENNYLNYEDFLSTDIIVNGNWSDQKMEIFQDIPKSNIVKVELTETMLELVSNDLGIGIIPKWMAFPYLECCDLKALTITKNGINNTWYLGYLSDSAKTSHINQLTKLLREEISI